MVFATPLFPHANAIVIKFGISKKAAIVIEMDYKDKYTIINFLDCYLN